MIRQIQPIIVGNGHQIEDLLNEVSLALCHGGLSWVDRGKGKSRAKAEFKGDRKLMTSIDDDEDEEPAP